MAPLSPEDSPSYDSYYWLTPFPSPSPAPSPYPFEASLPPVYPPSTLPHIYPPTKHQLLRTLLLAVASVLATCALLLTYYAVLRRYRSLRRRRTAAVQPPAAQDPPDTDDELREDLLAAGASDPPYHVWHIRTVGLDERTIEAISAVAYRKGEGLVEDTDCAVCLGEFRDGEMLRLLPKCSHAFHIPCIDIWLRSHLNCPLCRAPILAPAPPPVAASDPPSSSSPSPSSSSASSPAVGDHPSSSREEPEIWMRIDLGEDGGSEDGDGHPGSGAPPTENGGNRRATLQRVRRTVSMDPSALGGLLRRMGLVGISGDEGHKPTLEEHPSAAKEGVRRGNNRPRASLVDARPPEMERSMSTGGERLLPSRFSGRTRCAILPL